MPRDAESRRAYWVSELASLSGSFGDDTAKVIAELRSEIDNEGQAALLDHLRICGAMPEHYGHDSSAEKLYSKYTDAVISEGFGAIGLQSVVLDERADAADVQAKAPTYSLVADAKAFRLSRTAKNQKDFKVQAMDGWRGGLDFAIVVCPIYQLPSRMSQIYQQAIARNVCVLSYSHLAALVGLRIRTDSETSTAGLRSVLERVSLLHPSKSAVDYWTGINGALVEGLGAHRELWEEEKIGTVAALQLVKNESLTALREERDRLLGLSHDEALKELVKMAGVDSRIAKVESVALGSLLDG